MFKDGLLVGSVTAILAASATIGTFACKDAVTIGEAMSCGNVSVTGGSKEKSSVVSCGGTKMASTL